MTTIRFPHFRSDNLDVNDEPGTGSLITEKVYEFIEKVQPVEYATEKDIDDKTIMNLFYKASYKNKLLDSHGLSTKNMID